MLDVMMFIKINGYGTGVSVSASHLNTVLNEHGVESSILYYEDDKDLLNKVHNTECRLIILQVPSFSLETLETIVKTGRKVLLATHSTMCNLQVEGDALTRLLDVCKWDYKNFSISIPSEVEVTAFNSFSKVPFYYLPNTYSYRIDENDIRNKINKKVNENVCRISIFCAIRSFKNILTQMLAVSLLSKEVDNIELHLLSGNDYLSSCIDKLGDELPFKVIRHEQCSNEELLETTSRMHAGMQVSLSETFSYVAFEHMIMGVPVVASNSVKYANEIADYSSAVDMKEKLKNVLLVNDYPGLCYETVKMAKRLRDDINSTAVKLIEKLLKD